MLTRILHVSDLHVGARDDPILESALRSLADRTTPELLLVSGDLTHRGRRDEHEQAAELVHSLGVAAVAVPGNHDIPYTAARLTRPWREFDRQWQTTEPLHDDGRICVVGANSVRPFRHQSGALAETRLALVEQRLRAAPADSLRIVVLHHQLANAPWRTRKRPLARRDQVLERLAAAGAELIVGGHVHQASIAERREFSAAGGRGVVLTTAPGLGRPRPERTGEARGALVYRCDDRTITVDTYAWLASDWMLVGERRFPRS